MRFWWSNHSESLSGVNIFFDRDNSSLLYHDIIDGAVVKLFTTERGKRTSAGLASKDIKMV